MASLLIPESIASAKEGVIVGRLRAWGEKPCGAAITENGKTISIGFEIISAEPKWRKTVEVAAVSCSASEIHDQLNAWREKVRGELHRGEPSVAVRKAIECFGSEAVRKALEHVGR